MNNDFENEKITQSEDEFSTIFSDPAAHKQVKTKKSNKVLIAVALCLSVAILICCGWGIPKICGELDETEDIPTDNAIELVDYDAGDMKTVNITNKNGSFEFYSVSTQVEDGESGEEITQIDWYLKGYDKTYTSSGVIEQKMEQAVDFDAIREITTKTEAQCGLDKPVVTITAESLKGDKFTVKVGAESPDKMGIYVKISGKDGIYIVGSRLDEILTFTDIDLASTDAQGGIVLSDKYDSYYSDGALSDFDSITVSGKYFDEKLVFELNDDTVLSSYIPYVVKSPIKRSAENVDGIFSVFADGFPVSGAYAYNVEAKTLSKYGLNNPDFQLSAKFGDFTYTYKFKKQEDGYFAVVGTDSKVVKKISADEATFLYYRTEDFYSKIVFMTSIDEIKNLTIKTDSKTYSFDIEKNPSGSEELNKYIVECDGKVYNSSYFQSFYQYLCMLELMDFDTEQMKGTPEMTIIYSYNDSKRAPTQINFHKVSATKYQCSVDGIAMGKIGSSSFKKISKNLESLLAGKQVIVN